MDNDKQYVRSLNALKHGASAKTLFLPDEDPTQFDLLLDDAYEQYKPATAQEDGLVYDSVEGRWYLSRRQKVRAAYELLLHTSHTDSFTWGIHELEYLERLDRYCTTAERAFRRALVNVRFIRSEAVKDEKWRELLALRKESLKLAREKFEHAKKQEARRNGDALKENLKSHQEATTTPVQQAFISVVDSITMIDQMSPSNDEVRKLIATTKQSTIVRHYTFLNDIPEEYSFLVPNGFERNSAKRYEIRHQMEAAQFLKLARREDEEIAHFSTNQSEISDEDWVQLQRNKTK